MLMGADYYEQYEECEAFQDCLPLGVGKGTHIRGAIVDKNARIGKFCKIINSEGIQVRPAWPASCLPACLPTCLHACMRAVRFTLCSACCYKLCAFRALAC